MHLLCSTCKFCSGGLLLTPILEALSCPKSCPSIDIDQMIWNCNSDLIIHINLYCVMEKVAL